MVLEGKGVVLGGSRTRILNLKKIQTKISDLGSKFGDKHVDDIV